MIFSRLYDITMKWAKHKNAEGFLGVMSFSESVIFPIPVDVMLAPMSLAKPENAWRYALIASITSVLGGILGYFLGLFFFESSIQPYIASIGYQHKLDNAIRWFSDYGVWVVFISGFSPIPYKVFTITAGFMQMALIPFVIASAIGRSMRFYMVCGLMRWGGGKMEQKIRKYVDVLGWAVVILGVLLYLALR